MDYQFRIATRIRKARELSNYTQEYVAQQIGLSQQQYSQIEKGQARLSPERLHRIAEVLNTTADKIADFDERMFFGVDGTCNFNDNSTMNKINEDRIEDIKKIYEDRIKEQAKEIERLHGLLEKALTK